MKSWNRNRSELRSPRQRAKRTASGRSWPDIFTQVIDFATKLVHCSSCLVYAFEEGQVTLRGRSLSSNEIQNSQPRELPPELLDLLRTKLLPVSWSQSISIGGPFHVLTNWLPRQQGERALVVPLVSRDQFVGAIFLEHSESHVYTADEITLLATIGFLLGSEISRSQLAIANAALSEELETRKLVERGKGILQRDLGMNEEEAYLALQQQSRRTRVPLKEIAEAVILSDDVKKGRNPKPEPAKQQPTGTE